MNLQTIIIAVAVIGAAIAGFFLLNNNDTDHGHDGPTTQLVLDRMKQALGGEQLEKATSFHILYEATTAGLTGTYEEWYTTDGQHREFLDLGVFNQLVVFDKTQGWLLDQNGQRQNLAGVELENELTDVYTGTYSFLFNNRQRGEVHWLGEDETEGVLILAFHPNGGTPITYFVDKTSYLPVKSEQPSEDRTVTVHFGNWQQADGMWYPARTHQTNGNPEFDFILEVQEFQVNPPIEAALFTEPKEAGPAFEFAVGNQSLDIPIQLVANHIYLPTQVDGQDPLWFVLDSGAGATVIDTEWAAQFNLDTQGNIEGRGTGQESVNVQLINGVSLGLPGVELKDQTIASIALGQLGMLAGRRIDGIIGYNFFNSFIVEIDYEHSLVHLYDPATYEYTGNGTVIPFIFEENLPTIEADLTVAGETHTAKFTIDTGATSALGINKPFSDAHQLMDKISPLLTGLQGFGVGGGAESALGRIDSLAIGPYTLPHIATGFSLAESGAFADPNRAGLIGGEVLRRFTVIFDYGNQVMILEPNGDYDDPFPYDLSGLTLINLGDQFNQFMVFGARENSPADQAGVRKDDLILTVDGRPASEFTLYELRQYFTQGNISVTLQLQRGDEQVEAILQLEPLI